jgi:hypothetical protein
VKHYTIEKNGWGFEPQTVFAQQNSGSTLPINSEIDSKLKSGLTKKQ